MQNCGTRRVDSKDISALEKAEKINVGGIVADLQMLMPPQAMQVYCRLRNRVMMMKYLQAIYSEYFETNEDM